jgi:hypothetical protein
MQALIQWQTVIDSGAGVPSPIDKSSDIYWYDLGAFMCREFANAGITDLLNMPEWEGQNLGNNYDTRAEYGLGEINPLRGGSRESLGRFAAILKANGMGFHSDLVLAHRDGCQSSSKIHYGRGPSVSQKTITVSSERMSQRTMSRFRQKTLLTCSGNKFPITLATTGTGKRSNGRGYPKRQIIKALEHLFAAFEKQGVRWDNVKSLDPSLIRDIWNSSGAHHGPLGRGGVLVQRCRKTAVVARPRRVEKFAF